MPKHSNPAHLINFHTDAKDFYRIVSPYVSPKGEPLVLVYSSGRTEEETREHFYERFMMRECDREMMLQDQKRGGFIMQRVSVNHATLIEGPLLLLAEV